VYRPDRVEVNLKTAYCLSDMYSSCVGTNGSEAYFDLKIPKRKRNSVN